MCSAVIGFLPEHDVHPEPTTGDRVAVLLLAGALCVATAWLEPIELVLLCWAGLGGWGLLRVRAQRRANRSESTEPAEPSYLSADCLPCLPADFYLPGVFTHR